MSNSPSRKRMKGGPRCPSICEIEGLSVISELHRYADGRGLTLAAQIGNEAAKRKGQAHGAMSDGIFERVKLGVVCPGSGTPTLLAIDPRCHDRNRLLIDARRVPLLDHREVGLAFLVAAAWFPALLAQEVCG